MQENEGMTAVDGPAAAAAAADGLADSLGRWMATAGYTRKSASKARAALRALAAAWPGLPATGHAGLAGMEGFDGAVASLPEWQQKDARSLPRLLAFLEDDRAALSSQDRFRFYHVNPGASALGFGAERAGGEPVGATHVSAKARKGYIAFHGDNSIDDDPAEPFDIVIADLPFSVFPEGDPELASVVKAAAHYARRAKATLFRVDWSAAERMGLGSDAWKSLVEAALPGQEARTAVLRNEHFVPMDGAELFVGAAKSWIGEFRPVLADIEPVAAEAVLSDTPHTGWASVPKGITARRFPKERAGRIDPHYPHAPRAAVVGAGDGARMLFPLEIMAMLGFPERYPVPRDRFDAYHLLGDSVAVPVAERAVRGLLRAVGMV